MDFHKLKFAVEKNFKNLSQYDLFCTDVTGDDMWDTYLGSFPEGTNPIYRKRTWHDCSCCRQFVKTMGSVVAIVDDKLVSIWDVSVGDSAYQTVVDALSALAKSASITNRFLHTEKSVGRDKTFEDGETVKEWEHFYAPLYGHNSGKLHYCSGAEKGPKLSDFRADHDVLFRSLTEITMDAADTVLDLIKQNSLYRGTEHQFAVNEFRKLKVKFDKAADKDVFAWSNLGVPAAVKRIRNTSIGTLLVDLSEGMDLEDAVRRFEAMVAPQNYKRPTALVTKAMVEKAKKTIEDLGLIPSLERRYAQLRDINVNDIIFANRDASASMKGGDVFSELAVKKSPPKLDKVETISIEKFISDVVPNANSIEVFFENGQQNNLVSLIAPVHPDAKSMFTWDNNFSWSYNGDMADSIKERVKTAGGNVTGDLCCRLAWFNYDDLDFHMREPGGHIFFGDRQPRTSHGQLDVDMNAGSGKTRKPVENIFYGDRHKMKEGVYHLYVNQYSRRETSDVGFQVEIDFMGTVHQFNYDRAVTGDVTIAKFKYSHTKGIEFLESLPSSQTSKTVWNLATQEFHKVNVMMMSPNYWGDKGTGNKHYFFMLDQCQNDGKARGFFNEFLKNELAPHRKVIEMVGAKMVVDEATDQLSGLGFSSTKRNEVLVRVSGNFTRTVKVLI